MHCSSSGAPNGNMMGNSTDMLASFGNTSCNAIGTAPDMSKDVLNQDSRTHSHQGGVAQMEWSKIQHQFFEERLKGGKPRQVTGTVVTQQQTPSGTGGNSSNSQVRPLQGPPPPYHSTQRSASVPIATQSPNPSSPNNLSLPSPRTTAAVMGLPTNSPSMDGTGSLSGSAPQANTSAVQAGTTTRQTSAQGGSVQFTPRSDNIPLNPNSGNRPPPNKMTQNFDPISSLAQMSQQLTSCVSSMGSPAGTGGMTMMGGPGPSDINIEHGMISGLDGSGIDAINQNNCHSMNVVMNSMGPRMLNPKMCVPGGPNGPPGFNPNSPNGGLRENSIGSASIPGCGSANSPNFQGVVPPGARMMGRMPVNFGSNFNPNIQVKASTPNTIQYMPVRAQNTNNNNNNGANNVRMPPSLEFLQRYANPQMGPVGNGSQICPPSACDGTPGMPGMMVGPGAGAMLMNSSGEQHQNKITNNPGASNGINFFQNCNQMSIVDEEGGLPGHDGSMNIGQPSMIRGMRPHAMRPNVMGARKQPVNRQIQFAQSSDGLDCANQPKTQHLKNIPSGMCQNQPGLAVAQGQIQLQGQGQAQGQSLIGPTNLMSNAGSVSATNGVSGINFVGPSSTDLKYAQQYHSFQQQLYATNTRSQQQQHMHQQHQSNMITMPPNLSPNPTFFVNK
ncbi:GD24382 [Drosophila simulans]|uniref:GD24382 n=1 Tax=Drosophila simulans TaxID=7240 RepID=B4R2F1_DROSI|nr:GD24382 [Drosophila simulans]